MQLIHAKHIGRLWSGRAIATLAKNARPAPAIVATRQPQSFTSPYLAQATQRRSYADIKLDFNALDKKWREKWKASKTSPAKDDSSKPNQYVLPMFPYPSGTLHLGHLRVYTIADVLARYHTMKGSSVMLPMGWDAFGLPAENAAIDRGIAPATWTKTNIAKMKEQLEVMNGSWDWERELTTCDPDFYKHTQKIFLMLHKRGLAYQTEAEVNYDPVDMTVLANEQVDANGNSWRSGAKVEKRQLKQWFFRISEFREALLKDLDTLAKNEAWPERVLAMQKNWLGKSTGAVIKFPVMAMGHDVHAAIEVFTTRPDTLFGVQYLALASTHPIVTSLAKADPELQAFLDTLPALPKDSKVGYMLPHVRAVNPLAYHEQTPDDTKKSIPVYVAPYVLGDYGEGAVMGVPGHDLRDNAFWKEHHYDEPVRFVLAASEDESTSAIANEPFVEHGTMTANSGPFKGKSSAEAGRMLIGILEAADLAKPVEKWRLRDWLISRQRYWGTPIPVIHCGSCGPVPVPDDQLPVTLPDVSHHWTDGKAGNPLERAEDWVNTSCPKCGGHAKRDTDTMDTFVDSSWYYARFVDPHNVSQPLSVEAAKSLPVDLYIGGIEHAILHLLYARFIYKFLATTELFPASGEADAVHEPFKRLITQGMVHGKTYTDPKTGKFLKPDEVDLEDPSNPKVVATGATANVSFEKMSKSKYNGVDPTEFISKYGADATRAHVLFQAPVGDILNWDEDKIAGVTRWLHRLHDHAAKLQESSAEEKPIVAYLEERANSLSSLGDKELAVWDADTAIWRAVQGTIGSITQSYETVYPMNTIVSDLMSLTNTLQENTGASPLVQREAMSVLLRMMAPIAPAFSEECWRLLHPKSGSIFEESTFPAQDNTSSLLKPRRQPLAIQINGKLRGVVEVPNPPSGLEGEALRDWMVAEVLKSDEGKAKFAGGQFDVTSPRRVILARGGKTINFVV
ncbi:leucyl-tRNA synthetase [Colletotrichum orchidophilum]|uniref:leucine--tRNA ligase n=1 Tax=Colletotrichum orchidophilum TaxID=1209926 RepID=A0A1G4B284_9PEZI|nr:leucyl-tRNA synthetase [Colletotrichum orchidophilum]OHE95445.1 leucyl-tRNA synthetase [Colletotrichum orchidophilum]